MIKYIEGDAIRAAANGDIEVVIQGCNCFNTMGAGIAAGIKNTWPGAYEEDWKTTKGDREKLGTFTSFYDPATGATIVNAYTQFTYWDTNDMLSYKAIEKCMREIKERFKGKKIGMPKIGCGLARGDWGIVERIINDELEGEDVTVYIYKG